MQTEDEATGPVCRVCGAQPTIKAHLMPEAFVRQVHMLKKSGEQHIVIHPDLSSKQASKTGRYDLHILCGPCDGKLGRYEDSALRLLNRLRPRKVGVKNGSESVIREGNYPFRAPSPSDFIRFACGILWKYGSISPDISGHIDLGQFRGIFEDVCFRDAAIPRSVDVGIERDMYSFAGFTDPNDVYYYRTPSLGGRGRDRVAQLAWFSVAGFIVYVRFDANGPSDHLPTRCWMRGKEQLHFHVSLRSMTEAQFLAPSIMSVSNDLNKLNGKLVAKAAFRASKLPPG